MLPRGLISRNLPDRSSGEFTIEKRQHKHCFAPSYAAHKYREKRMTFLDFAFHDNGRPMCGDFYFTGYDRRYNQRPRAASDNRSASTFTTHFTCTNYAYVHYQLGHFNYVPPTCSSCVHPCFACFFN